MTDYTYTTAKLVQAEIQSEKQFSATTDPSKTTVDRWIKEISEYVNEMSGTVYGQTTYTEDIDYEGSEYITLKNSPVISVTTLKYNKNPIGSSSGEDYETKTEDTDYTVYNDRGQVAILFNNFNPSTGRKRIEIVYEAGFATTPVSIQQLATKMVALRVLNSVISSNVNEGNDGGSVSVGSISIVEPSGIGINSYKQLKQDVRELLDDLTKGNGVYRYTV